MTEADATPLGHGEGPIDRVIHALNRSFVVLASVALILMMLHVTAEVAARATGWLTLIGTLEIVSYYYIYSWSCCRWGLSNSGTNISASIFSFR